ncbi:MAG: SOS response-associated peptidase family protein [Stellaceae bacterium]
MAENASGTQPYAVALADQRPMALAGLWETWRSSAGERVISFMIVTTTPNELCAGLHSRMMVILARRTGRPGLVRRPPIFRSSKRCSRPTRPTR